MTVSPSTPRELLASSEVGFGFTAPTTADEVRALEDLGIASLWVGGHVASPNPTPEVIVALARLSAQSTTAVIGSSILLLPLYPAAIVAKQLADLDRACGGRVVLGVGIGGEYEAEFRACQVPRNERAPRTDEAIPLLRELWTAEPVRHERGHYAMGDGEVRIHPAPRQPGGPPIVVAGRQPAAMRRAAILGDGWMPYMYSPRRYAESVATIRAEAEASGRDLTGFGWTLFSFISIRDDGDEARREAARFMGGTYRQNFEEMVRSVAIAGTPDEVTERLAEFVRAGVRHFVFAPAARDQTRTWAKLLRDDLVPNAAAAASR
ncbi:MAG TPA: LLM class flavin-dependent oxidoreductase [Acidimicrobiia bacterium]|nr:LLM class flavin-dependent oxidoreductase [Acidimicrobiia bacterium]